MIATPKKSMSAKDQFTDLCLWGLKTAVGEKSG